MFALGTSSSTCLLASRCNVVKNEVTYGERVRATGVIVLLLRKCANHSVISLGLVY